LEREIDAWGTEFLFWVYISRVYSGKFHEIVELYGAGVLTEFKLWSANGKVPRQVGVLDSSIMLLVSERVPIYVCQELQSSHSITIHDNE
jgi:hypothetical protein